LVRAKLPTEANNFLDPIITRKLDPISEESIEVNIPHIYHTRFKYSLSLQKMSTIYLVSGGARSGKSGYAQSLCEYLSKDPIYLATSEVSYSDEDFAKRVKKHQNDRGEQWTTIEEPLEPSKHLEKMKGKVVLVDCCTLWLTNYMMQEGLFSLDAKDDAVDTKDKGLVQDASERALRKIEQEVRATK